MTASSICPHRLSIITGHYGTGKTEFAVNLALARAATWTSSTPISAPVSGSVF